MIAATGFFDGVHLGHRAVLQHVLKLAGQMGKKSAVITFWPHPRVILHRDAEKVRLLNAIDEKKEILYGMGIEQVHVLPFTDKLSKLSPEQFFTQYLVEQFQVNTLVVGHDHHLGSNANANYEAMQKIGATMGIKVAAVAAVEIANASHQISISSTKIRESLRTGNIDFANACLGYPYMMRGVVVEGNKIGRTINYPTANMQLYEPLKQLPADGVYAVKVRVEDKSYLGMMNIGLRPTIGDMSARTIETHIFNFDEDIYGQSIEVLVMKRIRSEQQFLSLDELKSQLNRDKEQCIEQLA